MSDWVVETPSFEEDLMNNRVVMLNQIGVNRVVEIIKKKDKKIKRLNKEIIGLNNCIIEFHSEFCNKQAEINRLNNIINKGIDFLKKNACIDEDVEYFCDDLRYDDCKKLLGILKGNTNEKD